MDQLGICMAWVEVVWARKPATGFVSSCRNHAHKQAVLKVLLQAECSMQASHRWVSPQLSKGSLWEDAAPPLPALLYLGSLHISRTAQSLYPP